MAFVVASCSNDSERQIHGGDIVKAAVVYSSEDELEYQLPLITNKKIDNIDEIKINDIETDGSDDYKLVLVEVTEGAEYNDWFYYYAHISLSVQQNNPESLKIKSFDFEIDGDVFNYTVSKMEFSNFKEAFGKTTKNGVDILYENGKTFLYQFLPNETVQTVDFEVVNDCTFKEFGFTDFVEVEDLSIKINGIEQDTSKKIKAKAGDTMAVEYVLKYKGDASEKDMITTTEYIKYVDENGKESVFCDDAGLVVVNYNNDNFIKTYIDTLN